MIIIYDDKFNLIFFLNIFNYSMLLYVKLLYNHTIEKILLANQI